MKLATSLIFGFITFTSTGFGQTMPFFPGKALYWTNLERPKYLDSLKSLGFLSYKNQGVVRNKRFVREIAENDTLRKFETTLDFYKYKINWKRKGRRQFSIRQKGTFYFYYGHATAIYCDKYFKKE